MAPERWQQIEDIFQTAVDLPAQQRSEYLATACAQDDELRTMVDVLIVQLAQATNFIETPVVTGNTEWLEPLAEGDPLLGRRIGAYRLESEIGRGGMGAVYLGVRADNEFQKQVAIKLVKRGMDTDFILRRFRRERQILASLDHPHIARLLDGGTTDDGLPYFVMEYIEGQPLYQYCDSHQLSISARLNLFRQICDAVHFAHQHLVVHRDLKPSNILVTASTSENSKEGEGMPKLLDFGIAKLLNPAQTTDTLDPTGTAMRLMTPEYASPEQVRGERATPTSDVYSLGALLYELLTGHRPYRLRGRALHEIARVVCEEEPIRPSVSLTGKEDTVLPGFRTAAAIEVIAQTRGTNPEALQHELTGDLDRITLKALRKDPRQRYQSAAELREDITRYLEGRPISATFYAVDSKETRPLTPTELQSNGTTAIAILPLKLLTFAAQEDTGDRYLSIGLADALITRLSSVHSLTVRPTSSILPYAPSADDEANPLDAGRELGVDFVLDGRIKRAAERIRISLQLLDVSSGATVWAQQFDEPCNDVLSLEDAITSQVADVLLPRLTGEERRRLNKRATDDAEAFEAYLRGRYHWNSFTEEGFAKAIVAYHQAIACDPNYALAYAGIADYYNWLGVYGVLPPHECFSAAIDAATKAIAINSQLSEAYAALGFAAVAGEYDWARGEAACRRAIDLNPHNAQAQVWYSLQLTMEGRFDEGVMRARRGIELDPMSAFNAYNLGWILYFTRRFDECAAQFRRVIAAHALYPLAHYGLSWVLRFVGQHEESIREAKRAAELSNDSSLILMMQAQAYAAAGMRQEAESFLARLEIAEADRPVSSYHVALIHSFLGEKEKALDRLERSYAEREAWPVWLAVEPVFDDLRNDPRFLALLQKTHNPAISQHA